MPLPEKLAYRFYQWFYTGLDWLYPPVCAGCGRQGARWCPECQAAATLVTVSICPVCGQIQSKAELCSRCRAHPPSFTAVRAWAQFEGPVRKALHSLKYKRNIGLGEALARPLVGLLASLHWQIDLISPVPLGVARLAERGYNQADLIARPLAFGAGLPYAPQIVSKIRETRSQVDLNAAERRKNVAGAFQANAKLVHTRRILLVDDVMTSGATLNACATACLEAGAQQVYGLTFARAVISTQFV